MKFVASLLSILILAIGVTMSSAWAVNRALNLGGIGDYVKVPHSESLNPEEITIEAWVKPYTMADMKLVGKGYLLGDGKGIAGYLLSISAGGRLYPEINDEDKTDSFAFQEGNVPLEEWSHIALTFSREHRIMIGYINGEEVGRISNSGKTIAASTEPLIIGTGTRGFRKDQFWFIGIMDELRIWNVARTQEEIQATMHTSLIASEPELIGYWRFDEPPDSKIASDSSPYGNNGALLGSAVFVESDAPIQLPFQHDAMIVALLEPEETVEPAKPIVPVVRLVNGGKDDETDFTITFEITEAERTVYSETHAVEDLASLRSQDVSFAEWTPQIGGQYQLKATVHLPGDENPNNDSLTLTVKPWIFVDVTDGAGLADETGGECVAVGDYDGDGDVDLYTGRLYQNEGDRTFTDVTNISGLATIESVIGAVFGDIDGDGDLDILVVDGQDVAIYRNSGHGTFDEVTPMTGLKREGGVRALCLADYDGDGNLDIYIARIGANRLYHNNGDGTFTDVTETTGGGDASWNEAVVFGDYNWDNVPDIYVANWGAANVLYRNDGDGTFTDISDATGTGHPGSAKDVLLCDYDGDGDSDLFVANGSNQPDVLYRNNGDGSFTDVTIDAGLGGQTWAEAASCGDYDGDGRSDLYLVVSSGPNLLYRNNGDGTFSRTQQMAESDADGAASAAAFFDCDGDGDVDLFVANIGQPNVLYRNTTRRSTENNEGR